MGENTGDQKGISRRGFLKGTAVAVAAGATGSLIPESRAAASAAGDPAPDSKPPARITNLSVDICVIGGGGAGVVSAVSALEAGVKNIIVLEKMKQTGGSTKGVMGFFSVESPVQKRQGIQFTADECFKYHMDMHSWYCNAKLVRNWMTSTGSIVDWLEKKGIEFGKVVPFTHERLLATHHSTKTGGTGQAVMQTMLKILKENNVEVRTDTRVKKLLTNGNGDVTGVVAVQGDEELRISAKAVIIGTGSISANEKLKARFYPGEDQSNVYIMGAYPCATGDGLIMAEEIGAGSTHISTLFIGPHGHNTDESVGTLMRRPNLIKINRLGYRFVDEAIAVTRNFPWMNCLALDRQPDKVCYVLIDEATLRQFQKEKKMYALFEEMGGPNWLANLDKAFPEEVKKGRAKIAGTWDEIAEYIGCDPEILKNTITQYNSYCQNKYDAEFLKDPEYLLPLTKPPYYAMQGYSGIDTCIGGLRTNHNLEVVNKKEAPIKGLYAAGVVVGNWLGIGYGFFGSEFSFTSFSGYAAGKNAAEFVLKKA